MPEATAVRGSPWIERLARRLWGVAQIVRHGGAPMRVFAYLGGVGDELMATTVFRELGQRGARRLWMVANHPALFRHNPDCAFAAANDDLHWRLVHRLRAPVTSLVTQRYDAANDRDIPAGEGHLIAVMCRLAGLSGAVELRPYLFLTAREKMAGRLYPRQIVIQTSGLAAASAMRNKEWYPPRFQQVVDELRGEFEFVQVGAPADPVLAGVHDLRGKTTLRETAGLMRQSQVFVGLVGGLMHLARAVDCRSVIIYGGRELPAQSGYPCNANLSSLPPCAPCWMRNRCDYDRRCLQAIDAAAVVAAIRQQAALYGTPLGVERVELN